MCRLSEYFRELVRSGTRTSSSRFVMLIVAMASVVMLLVLAGVLAYDVVRDGEVTTSLTGVAAVIGAVTTLLTAVCGWKAYEKGKSSSSSSVPSSSSEKKGGER